MSTLIKTTPLLRSPFGNSFQDMFERLLGDTPIPGISTSFIPQADVLETEDAYLINLAVPGMQKDLFNLNLEDGVLRISGERKSRHAEQKAGFIREELAYGSFQRSFRLPDDVLADQISAQYTDGLLEVRLPKDTQKNSKLTIPVQ
ncbi:MAG: Hsp20/alpha crystallin family protein [Bacteroidetes bacterium]|nr:Hsp20/alpha crystallin family protein [Bacteroidota bacterium]